MKEIVAAVSDRVNTVLWFSDQLNFSNCGMCRGFVQSHIDTSMIALVPAANAQHTAHGVSVPWIHSSYCAVPKCRPFVASETDLVKLGMESMVLFDIISISWSSKKIISFTARASSFVCTWKRSVYMCERVCVWGGEGCIFEVPSFLLAWKYHYHYLYKDVYWSPCDSTSFYTSTCIHKYTHINIVVRYY